MVVSVASETNRVPVSRHPDGGLSQASADAVYAAVIKAGEAAYFCLEQGKNEAVIYSCVGRTPITDWLRMTDVPRHRILHAPAKEPEQRNEER